MQIHTEVKAAPEHTSSHLLLYQVGINCRLWKYWDPGTTSTYLQDHKMSNDYQHKERRGRSLERKVSAHSSEEREREKGKEHERRGEDKCKTKEQGRQKGQS